MALTATDLFVVHRGGTDYKYTYDALYNDIHAGDKAVNDGKLTIKNEDGDTLGEFTANQAGDTDVVIPDGFSGDYNDLINKPDINDGKLTITDTDGTELGQFTANQAGDTDVVLPCMYHCNNYIQNRPELPS